MTHDELERLVEYGQQLASERGLSGGPAALGDILREVVRRAVMLEQRRALFARNYSAAYERLAGDGLGEQTAHNEAVRQWQ